MMAAELPMTHHDHIPSAPLSHLPPDGTAQRAQRLSDEHGAYRARCLNLIASENVISDAVARAATGDLEGRYADFTGTDLGARKYRGGRYVVKSEELCSQLVRETFGAPACELRAISGHVAGNAVLMGLCRPGDLVMEVGQEGGGHRLAAKLAEAPLVDLRVKFLPFDPIAFNVDADAAAAAIEAARPRVVVLGSSTFLHPHPVAELAAVCARVGATLVYDASHVMGLIAAGRFQDPLREGADIVFGSTHKTLFGPQGGVIFGRQDVVDLASAGLYPPLVTNHHPFRIPALTVALAEHAAFGAAYADAVIANARAFASTLADRGIKVVGGGTDSHAVLVATPGKRGADVAGALEDQGIITNPSRLPGAHGGEGFRVGVQELTRRGGDETAAREAAAIVAAALEGIAVSDDVTRLAARLQDVHYTWAAA
jgi:glycine hydroxymethyltransferase